MEQFPIKSVIDFLTEALDINVNDICACVEVVIPYTLGNLSTGQHPSWRLDEVLKQGKFPSLELNGLSCTHNLAGNQIYRQILNFQKRQPLSTRPTGKGLDACHQFLHGEWLGKIVVRTKVQSLHSLGNLSPRRQKQDRSGYMSLPKGPQHAQTVASRHHYVEYDGIVGSCPGEVERIVTVVYHVHRMAFLSESIPDVAGHFLFIFSEKDTHMGKGGEDVEEFKVAHGTKKDHQNDRIRGAKMTDLSSFPGFPVIFWIQF
jgi:hypothetical protein